MLIMFCLLAYKWAPSPGTQFLLPSCTDAVSCQGLSLSRSAHHVGGDGMKAGPQPAMILQIH